METSFYSTEELKLIGLKAVGEGVLISRSAKFYSPETIVIGNNVRIDDFCILSGGCGIKLGNFIHIGCYCALFGGSGIIMKDFSGLSARVTLYSESDDYSGMSMTNPMIPDLYKPKLKKGKIILEKHVIIGASSTVLPSVHIEEGAAVGAHSLITKNCRPWSIYFGIPAKAIMERSQYLLKLEKEFLAEKKNR